MAGMTMKDVKQAEVSAKLLREDVEANAETRSPLETAGLMRFVVLMEAADGMADAITVYEAAGDGEEEEAFEKMLAARAAFRQAMRGER
jgi:hypothetical protein